MSRKRKNFKKRATKQHGSDKIMLDRETGTYFAVANVHMGRVTGSFQGPKKIDAQDAVSAFNDGLYRGITIEDDAEVV